MSSVKRGFNAYAKGIDPCLRTSLTHDVMLQIKWTIKLCICTYAFNPLFPEYGSNMTN